MKKPIIFLLTFLCLTVLNLKPLKADNVNGEFLHTVFFWLKNPADLADNKKFETSLKKFLSSSKYIKSMHLGVPADTNRPIIDTSYTYCLSLTFTSKENHDKYQEEEVHKIFIKESEKLWAKVLIYDSVNILN